jgi:capsular exopolysaccharide synthesis family protein
MNQMTEKNYYELLDILPRATEEELEQAYRRARKTYGEDSVAVYSLYSAKERENILKTIGMAYETLKDPAKRSAYDARLYGTQRNGYKNPDINEVRNNNAVIKEIHEVKELNSYIGLKKTLVVMDEVDPLAAEQYRILYTKLEQESQRNFHKTFAITSGLKGEGKTITAFNLAYMMAREFKKKVVLVECDLRNPSITSNFLGKEQKYGIVDVLEKKMAPDIAITKLKNSSLYFLLCKHNVRNSSKLLGLPTMKALLNTLKTQFDYVIIDCPPILHLADMNVLSRIVDGILLVVKAGKTPKDLVLKAINSMPSGKVVGIILNGVDISLKRYHY